MNRDARVDVLLCASIFLGVILYLAALPRTLGMVDESAFLFEAKRILDGEVLYRDVFWFAMPAAHWMMALVFWVFGATIETAKFAMAALHGVLAVLLFLTGRRLGVGRALAAVLPVAHMAIAYSACPYATPHWFATLYMVAILFVAVGRSRRRDDAWLFVSGLLVGGLAATYQHQGAAFALAVCVLIVSDEFVRSGSAGFSLPDVRWRLARFALGILVVAIPVGALMLISAGPVSLFEQIILLPLTGYRSTVQSTWGQVHPIWVGLAEYTFPALLAILPAVGVIGLLRLARRGASATERNQLVALVTLSGTTILSMAYQPDFIHLGLVAPVFFVFWAETLGAAARWIAPRFAPARFAEPIAAALLSCALAVPLYRNVVRAHTAHPLSHETAFGRIDFASAEEIRWVDRLRALMRDVPSRELFVYPAHTSLYLMSGSNNATPYQFFFLTFNSKKQIDSLVELLESKELPYIYAATMGMSPDDPILEYITRNYRCAAPGQFGSCIYQLRTGR